MKKIISMIAAAAMMSFGVSALALEDVFDTDQPRDKAINYLVDRNIITGYDDNFFHAERNITRAEMAAVLYRAEYGQTEPERGESSFTDVRSHWAEGYINRAAADGIINGIDGKTFAPDANITNEQAMKMLVCMEGFKDEAERRGGYPNGYAVTAVRIGLLDDIELVYADGGGGSWQKQDANRGDVAQMVYNAIK